jgi:hypothetical protein
LRFDPVRTAHDLDGLPRREQSEAGPACPDAMQGPTDLAVPHDVAERSPIDLAVVVVQEKRRGAETDATVRDTNLENRLGRRGHPGPQPGAGQRLLGAAGDRRGPAVEGCRLHRRGIFTVDHRDFDPGLRQGQAHCQPDHAAADNQHLAGDLFGLYVLRHPSNSADETYSA